MKGISKYKKALLPRAKRHNLYMPIHKLRW